MGTHGGKNWEYPETQKLKRKNSIEPPGCRRADGRWRAEGREERAGWQEGPDSWVSYFHNEGFNIVIKNDFLF